jgi:hypothetical protein
VVIVFVNILIFHGFLQRHNLTHLFCLQVLPRDPWVPELDILPVQNALLFAKQPRHPAWILIIKQIVSNVQENHYGVNPLAPTGPLAYGRALLGHGEIRARRHVALIMSPKER